VGDFREGAKEERHASSHALEEEVVGEFGVVVDNKVEMLPG
jgi:hypothetical protein